MYVYVILLFILFQLSVKIFIAVLLLCIVTDHVQHTRGERRAEEDTRRKRIWKKATKQQ